MRTSRRTVSVFCAAAIAFAAVAATGTSAHANARPNGIVTPKSLYSGGWRYGYLSVRTDVVAFALYLEDYNAVHNAYPTTKKQATAPLTGDKFTITPHVSLTVTVDAHLGYCVAGWNMMTMYKAATPKVYDPVLGGLQKDSTPGHVARCSTTYPHSFTLP